MNCDRLAPWYWALERLGMGWALERRRQEFLPDLATGSIRRVLLLGDGDGRFLAALLAANPSVEADTVDNSAEMLRHARRRAGKATPRGNVRFHHADATRWLPGDGYTYDAVVTHFFFDCLTEAEIHGMLVGLGPFLAPRAFWIVSEFDQPAHGLKAWRAQLWINGLYRLFGWTTGLRTRRLPDYRGSLQANGFRLEKEVTANHGLLVSSRWRRAGF